MKNQRNPVQEFLCIFYRLIRDSSRLPVPLLMRLFTVLYGRFLRLRQAAALWSGQ